MELLNWDKASKDGRRESSCNFQWRRGAYDEEWADTDTATTLESRNDDDHWGL